MASSMADVSVNSSLFQVSFVNPAGLDVDSDEDLDEDMSYQEALTNIFCIPDTDGQIEQDLVAEGWEISYSSSSDSSDCDFDIDDINSNAPDKSQAATPLHTQPPAKKKKPNKDVFPAGFDKESWVDGEQDFGDELPPFAQDVGLTVNIPDGANELYFFKLFITDEVVEDMTRETNRYHQQYMNTNKEKITEQSRLLRFPMNGMTPDRMEAFIALTFLMGIVKKSDIKDYWSTDELIATPFFAKIMSRDEYHNIQTFFHLTNNDEYVRKGSPGYNPRKKMGLLFTHLTARFSSVFTPHQHLSIDEGCIPFKGHVSFKCFNPNKPNKYHMKTFKVVDSVTKYCCEFDLYVGAEINENSTDFGQVHDLVFRLVNPYLGKSFIIYMDNWYSSPFLYHNLWQQQTGACGTSRYRKGYPTSFFKEKLKKRGDQVVISGNHIHAIRIFDCKPVCLISTVYGTEFVPVGKLNWQTKVPITKPNLMHQYNKYMGGVDYNDQLLQYSAYDRRSLKWWKKVAFRLLNLAMTNAYILYNVWLQSMSRKKITQVKFRTNVVKQILSSIMLQEPSGATEITEYSRLSGKHFPELIPSEGKKKQLVRRCVVCNPAERQIDKSAGRESKKRAGRESSFQCDTCKVPLCVGICFKLYHTQKNFVKKYIDLKKQ